MSELLCRFEGGPCDGQDVSPELIGQPVSVSVVADEQTREFGIQAVAYVAHYVPVPESNLYRFESLQPCCPDHDGTLERCPCELCQYRREKTAQKRADA